MLTELYICFLVIACLLFGAFYEFSGAILLVIASALLIFFIYKNKHISITFTIAFLLSLMLVCCYLASSIYAIDSGMAFLGFIKIAWIIPAIMCYQFLTENGKEKVFDTLPWIGTTMVLFGIFAYFIPPLKSILYTNGRFAGIFNYPNTQAIFLLLCIIWMCDKECLKTIDYIRYILLLIGISITGCRTVIVLTVFTLLYIILKNRNKIFSSITLGIALVGIIYIVLCNDLNVFTRITTISLNDSTFIGRFLYYQDALPLLLKYPFGMGYLGYYYIQNSIQTGLYSVMFIHNDLLQIGLDLGILPMILYFVALVVTIVKKETCMSKKIMIIVLFLHGLFDFDLSFGIMLLIMCLLLDDVVIHKKVIDFKNYRSPITVVLLFAICIGSYFIFPLCAAFSNNYSLANSLYPFYTDAKLALISASDDTEEVSKLADEILSQNKTCALAYYAKAMVADINENYDDMIKYGKKAIELDYFNIDEYENYTLLLYDGLISDNTDAYIKCYNEMQKMQTYMDDATSKLSPLGKKIKDQPDLSLTSNMLQILDALE